MRLTISSETNTMKRSYHTDILIQYKLGLLPQKVLKQIPSSTIDHWKKRDISRYFGMDSIADYEKNLAMMKDILSRKKLLNAAKALYYIHCSYVKLFEKVKYKKSIIRQSGATIIKTIDQVKNAIGQARALKAFGISHQQYYAWKRIRRCAISPANNCRKVYHNQLTTKEVDTIKDYLTKSRYGHWNITAVYFQMLRDKAAFIGRTTFFKYINRLNLQRVRPEKRKYDEGIRADAPKRILHMDVTIYRPLDHTKVYLYFLVDNFSRFILNWKASLTYSAELTFQNIAEAYDKYHLNQVNPFIDLICDGGSENKGKVDSFVNKQVSNIQKLIAKTDIIFSNSMVEAVNKRMKYDFLFTTKLLNIEQTIQYLIYAVEQYNNKPHSALFGLTPNEVFNGAIPSKSMFSNAIKQAATKRKEINLGQNCLNCL